MSINLAQKFSPKDGDFKNSKGVEYALEGNFEYYIISGSNLQNSTNPRTLNDEINRHGANYFGR
ncbi:hypothetical protein FACS189415_7450 [Bacteroidia bacterium]|nr:hypothetical protein FACS189415_7450 [Bacteroidia bacterium]